MKPMQGFVPSPLPDVTYERCTPAFGVCNRVKGHAGPHSQLLEDRYLELKEAYERAVIAEASKQQYCQDPLNFRVFTSR